MPKITIISGGEEHLVEADGQDTILRAAVRMGLRFPYECNSGGCGSCKFTLKEGELEELWPDAPGLSPRDVRKGRQLACQCRPRGDVVVEARLEEGEHESPLPLRREVAFVERIDLTHDMAEFVFRGEGMARFRPGQYAMFELPGVEGERAYSMAGLPNEDGEWRFIIRRVPDGKGTAWLFDAMQPGDVITLDAPYGHAWLRTDHECDYLLIGGGSGLSPLVSIARALVADEAMAGRQVHFFYGGRTPRDLCARKLVNEMSGPGASINVVEAISEPESAPEWSDDAGYIHEVVERHVSDLASYDIYFCGPQPMTEALQRMLMIKHKVPFEQLHFDRFF